MDKVDFHWSLNLYQAKIYWYVYICVTMHVKIARYLYTLNILARMFMLKH